MITYENQLSNLSYTNKDFQTIYPELLELADKLSYKWQPSISDESDPGVLLIKLAALVADKNNYNIDKNILELFPSSVTQIGNAREIFEQCGYSMKYYQSAMTDITFALDNIHKVDDDAITWEGNEAPQSMANVTYSIPKFTMISTVQNDIVFTILDEVTLDSIHNKAFATAIQGQIMTYSVNGSSVITLDNLDTNNRLYFKEKNVAENGIFISKQNSPNSYWEKEDNLLVHPLGSTIYKFGVSKDESMCYIEFPSDIANIIGEGLNIKYILTDGSEGKVGKNTLKNFFVETTITLKDNNVSGTVLASTENIYVTNDYESSSGEDPETITSAYRNYTKIKDTFNTLVSVRDYSNFVARSDEVSNGFVCDRTNDLQSSYKIITYDGNMEKVLSKVAQEEVLINGQTTDTKQPIQVIVKQPELNAFNLRMYALAKPNQINTTEAFNRTFTPIVIKDGYSSAAIQGILDDMEEISCVQHDFKGQLDNRPIMLVNEYPIDAKIIPQYKLTELQQADIYKKVTQALYSVLNSSQLNFGEEIEYDLIYDTIINCDPRIRSIILQDITYTTYAYIKDKNDSFVKVQISSDQRITAADTYETSQDKALQCQIDITAKSILAGKTPLLDIDDKFTISLQQQAKEEENDKSIIDNIESITTNSKLEVELTDTNNNKKSGKVTLGANESVYISYPSYITEDSFTSWCKYFINFDIPKDGFYKLVNGDVLLACWADEDNYYLKRYDDSETSFANVVSANFAVAANHTSSIKPVDSDKTIKEIFEYLTGIYTNSNEIYTISKDDPSYAIIKSVDEEICIATGTNEITPKKINEVEVTKATSNIFWILNDIEHSNTDEAVCLLFDEGESEYTLQNGEYFFYGNATGTTLTILGSGYKIRRNTTKFKWACPKISYDEFISGGAYYLTENDYWYTVENGTTVVAQETQYFQLGEGTTIIFDVDEGAELGEDIITNKIVINNAESMANKYLTNCEISYRSEDAEIATKIPKLVNTDGYTIYSILSLNVGPNQKQEIKEHQSIIWVNSEGETGEIKNCTMLADHNINIVGGSNISTIITDLLSTVTAPLSIYKFTETESNTNTLYQKDRTKVTFTFDPNVETEQQQSVELPVQLPEGNYLIPLVSAGNHISVVLNNGSIMDIHGKTDFAAAGVYYIKFSSTGNGEGVTLTITVKKSAEQGNNNSSIFLLNPVKYTNSEVWEGALFSAICKLDYDNQFNYTTRIDKDILIENPLSAQTFFDPNHPYLEYVIPKWDYNGSNIVITNKIK